MNMKFSEKGLSNVKIISLISGLFTIIVAITMLFSLIQLKILQPLDNPVLVKLKEQYDKDPENQDIKEQLRAVDLMARRAYFSSRWQVESGSYLLLAGAIIFVLCQKILSDNRKQIPEQLDEKQDLNRLRDRRRRYILGSSAIVAAGAVIASFILRNNLPNPSPVVVTKVNPGNVTIESVPERLSNTETVIPVTDKSAQSTPEQVIPQVKSPGITDSNKTAQAASYEKVTTAINFPNFRGDGGRGIAEGTGYPAVWNGKEGKNIKWKTKIPKPGFNSPVIWGNRIFLAGADNQETDVYCIAKSDGKILWIANATNIPAAPASVPQTSEDTGLSAPTLATNGSYVCAIFATGNLVCYDMDGHKVWAAALGMPKNHYGHSSSLIIHENILIVQFDRNDKSSLFGFNVATGELKWETVRGTKISWASPVIARFNGKPQVILNSDPFVAAYDPVTGKEIWKVQTMSAEIGPSPAVNDKMVYVANEFAKLVGIKVGGQPAIAWEDNQFLPEVSSPVATNELLFVATSYGTVACYNAVSGELLWNHEFNYGFYSSPMLNNESVYLLDVSGVMHIFKASRTFTLVAECPLGEKTVCTPAFSEKMIFIRGSENLYCIANI
jgi:outer membrane protein assembly factor BamB